MNIRHVAAVVALAMALAACSPTATEKANISALAKAMALSNDESAGIVAELRSLAAMGPGDGQRTYQGTDIPAPIRVLDPVAVVVSPKVSRIDLSGSGDDKVYLVLHEHGPGVDGKPHGDLIIMKGRNNGSEVWWRD